MIPIVSVIGESNSGKTTLIEALITELKKLGLRVGTVKHDARGHSSDTEGKDTWRHAAAGAEMIALSSDHHVSVFQPVVSLPSVEQIVDTHFNAVDLVIAEGFKTQPYPKIEVFRSGHSREWHAKPEELIAAVSDEKPPAVVPCFKAGEAQQLAAFLNQKFFESHSRSDVRVWVDGILLELNPFVKAFVGQTVKGMVSALRGGRGERIRIKVGR